MNTCVYAGSFDPVTRGHLAVVRRAARLFAHVRVLVADNPDKAPLFSASERARLAREVTAGLPQVTVATTRGLVIDHARTIAASALVRGVRDERDALSETKMAWLNEELAPELPTLLVPCPAALADVSSSRLKALARAGDDDLDRLCPPAVARALRARLSREEAA